MAKLMEDANEQHVRAVYIYKKTSQTKAYKDAAFTTQYTTSELKNIVEKGMGVIVLEDGSLAFPIKYAEASSIGSVYYITPNGTTATSADIASLVSVADPE